MTLLGRFAPLRVKTHAAVTSPVGASAIVAPPPDAPGPEAWLARKILDAKLRLHRKIIEALNLPAIDKLSPKELRGPVAELVARYVVKERLPLKPEEHEDLIDALIDEMGRLGPIEPLLEDPTINDILINTHKDVYVERSGVLERVPVFFRDEDHLMEIVNKIVAAVGRRVNEAHPMVDAPLADGSRINVAVRPVAVDGPLVSIRKARKLGYSLDQLVETASLTPQVAAVLAPAVRGRVSP